MARHLAMLNGSRLRRRRGSPLHSRALIYRYNSNTWSRDHSAVVAPRRRAAATEPSWLMGGLPASRLSTGVTPSAGVIFI